MAGGIQDANRVFDGWANLAGGVDGGRSPDLIDPDQCAEAENVVFRGGIPRSRPGFRDLTHVFDNEWFFTPDGELDQNSPADPTSIGSETAFKTKIFQGASYFSPPGQPACIMVSIGGRLFQVTPRTDGTVRVTEFPVQNQAARRYTHTDLDGTFLAPQLRNSELYPIAYMVQADRYHITQDGESRAIIFDGVRARRSEDDEVPTGTIMAYGLGRLVVVRDQDVYFGDLYGSHDGATAGESVLKFTETTFLNEGFPASISSSFGKITAAFFTPQQDSSTGDGELLVSAERGVSSFFLSTPREQWKQSAFQRIALENVGVRGYRSPVSKNGDVWFRADDGARSYRQARAEINGWAHLPLSTNVRKWMENDTTWLLDYASAITHDNRLYFTCSPQPNQGRLYHAGMLSLDFDVLSAFGQAPKPIWDGHFTGMKVTQLISGKFNGDERAFAYAIDEDGENHLYELTHADKRDFSGPITSSITMRSMPFRSVPTPNTGSSAEMPYNEKEIYQADMWIDEVTDTPVAPVLEYKPDQYPEFVPWGAFRATAPVGDCGAVTCGMCPTIRKGFYPRRRISKPPDACDSAHTGRSFRRGYEFQARLRWTGHAAIRKFRLHAQMIKEDGKAEC